MIKSGSNRCLPGIKSLIRSMCLFGLAFAAFSVVAATVPPDQQNPDEQFIHIMAIIDRADALRAAGQIDAAKVKYREAQTNLVIFKAYNPLFDPKTVAYRLDEVTARIDTRPPVPDLSIAKPSASLEAEPAAAASKSAVKLIDAGAEPRQVLRLHVKPGDKQMVIMTVKMNMDMDMGMSAGGTNASQSIEIPAMSMPMEVAIQSVAPNGDIAYQAVFEEPGVVNETNTPPQLLQALKMRLGKIKGLTCTGVISTRGVSKSVEVKAPNDVDPQVRQSIEQIKQSMHDLAMPTPEEAVGTGAKWEVKAPIKSQGMSVDQTADYQLTSVQGDKVNATFTLTQNTANQKVQYTGNGTGNITADLSRLVPLQGSMNMQVDASSQISMGNKIQTQSMKMVMNTTWESQ